MGVLHMDIRPITMNPSISHGKGHALRGHLNANEKQQENENKETTENTFPSLLLFAMKRKVDNYIQK